MHAVLSIENPVCEQLWQKTRLWRPKVVQVVQVVNFRPPARLPHPASHLPPNQPVRPRKSAPVAFVGHSGRPIFPFRKDIASDTYHISIHMLTERAEIREFRKWPKKEKKR